MKMFLRKSQFPPRAATNGRFMLKINVQQRTTTLNTKTTNNKEKIHEFNFSAGLPTMSFEQEKFSVTKT
jgi:hypothetical protein